MAGAALGIAFGVAGVAGSLQAQGVSGFWQDGAYQADDYDSSSQTTTIQIDSYNSFLLGQNSGHDERFLDVCCG